MVSVSKGFKWLLKFDALLTLFGHSAECNAWYAVLLQKSGQPITGPLNSKWFCLNKNGIEERDNDSFDHQLMKSLASAGDAQTASNYLENHCPLASIWYL